jgi:hypothetical protein
MEPTATLGREDDWDSNSAHAGSACWQNGHQEAKQKMKKGPIQLSKVPFVKRSPSKRGNMCNERINVEGTCQSVFVDIEISLNSASGTLFKMFSKSKIVFYTSVQANCLFYPEVIGIWTKLRR